MVDKPRLEPSFPRIPNPPQIGLKHVSNHATVFGSSFSNTESTSNRIEISEAQGDFLLRLLLEYRIHLK